MSFATIVSSWISSGKPTKQELFQRIKDDLDDHESRLSDVEAATVNTQPLKFLVQGQGVVGDRKDLIKAPYAMTVTGLRIVMHNPGISGTLSVDVQRQAVADVGSFATILSANATLAYNGGTVSSSPSIAIPSIPAGAILRLDIDSVQVGAEDFDVEIEHTVGA